MIGRDFQFFVQITKKCICKLKNLPTTLLLVPLSQHSSLGLINNPMLKEITNSAPDSIFQKSVSCSRGTMQAIEFT